MTAKKHRMKCGFTALPRSPSWTKGIVGREKGKGRDGKKRERKG